MPAIVPTPHPRERRIVFKNVDREGWTTDIDCYLKDGGYEELKKALKMQPQEIVSEVKA
jgi:NADH-quinone oxidoreductase subunit F